MKRKTVHVGIDVSKDGIDYSREKLNLETYNGDLLEYDFRDKEFDVACMWDTIEHLSHPHLYLEKIIKIN